MIKHRGYTPASQSNSNNPRCNRPRIGTALSLQSHSLPMAIPNSNYSSSLFPIYILKTLEVVGFWYMTGP